MITPEDTAFGERGEYVAGLLRTVVELIEDPAGIWHKAAVAVGPLAELLEDLEAVASQLAGTDHTPSDSDLAGLFLALARPRRLAGQPAPDTVDYQRPAPPATARGEELMALAAVLAFAHWVDPAPHGRRTAAVWTLYHDASDTLWLTARPRAVNCGR